MHRIAQKSLFVSSDGTFDTGHDEKDSFPV